MGFFSELWDGIKSGANSLGKTVSSGLTEGFNGVKKGFSVAYDKVVVPVANFGAKQVDKFTDTFSYTAKKGADTVSDAVEHAGKTVEKLGDVPGKFADDVGKGIDNLPWIVAGIGGVIALVVLTK